MRKARLDPTIGNAEGLPSRLATRIVERAKFLSLPVGAHFAEQTLADVFKVSRTPVRLALRILEEMDIVESRPNRGFFLKRPADLLESSPVAKDDAAEDTLYFQIAEDRLTGALPQRFTEIELIRRYQVTRARLLRLLARMAQEGWLDRLPGHGWAFQPILTSSESYEQSYRYRSLIEPAALLEPNYEIDRAAFAHARMQQQAMLNGGILRYSSVETFQIGAQFHETLVAASGNPFLLDGLRRVNRLRRLVEYRIHRDRTRLAQICKEHLKLLDMLEAGMQREAAQFMIRHLDSSRVIKLEIVDHPETLFPRENAGD